MHRHGHLIERIIEPRNMQRAFDEVVSQLSERRVRRPDGSIDTLPGRRSAYRARRDEILDGLARRIADGSFRIAGYRVMTVTDGPKRRVVQSPSVTDRIACNAIMRIVEDAVYPSVIPTSAASIPGRGMHRLFAKVRRDIEADPEGTRYYYKADVRKFYESIDQDVMWRCVTSYVKDPILLPILRQFVTMMPAGLSIGLRSSQCFGNLLLSAVDHHFKDRLGLRYYYRYCDDIVMLAPTKSRLWTLRDELHAQVRHLGLDIKPDEAVRPTSVGLDFLGYVYDGTHARVRRRTKQRAARRLAYLRSRRRRREVIASFKGMAQWADARHLYKTITGKTMYDSSDIKSVATDDDGKKHFRGSDIRAAELVGRPFVVLDFERVVPPRERARYELELHKVGGKADLVAPPKEKYLVSILYDGHPRKLWTGQPENKAKLDKAKDDGRLPFFTTLAADTSGRFPCYTFASATALGFPMPTDAEVAAELARCGMA